MELGRTQLYQKSLVGLISYWIRLVQMDNCRFAYNAYQMLKCFDEHTNRNWVTYVREILYKYGFGYTWLMQDVGNKHIFLSAFKQRVDDCFQQEWHDKIKGPKGPKAHMYTN